MRGVAVDGTGDVAIGMSAASAIEILASGAQTFRALPLPPIGDVSDIAFFADGSLAATMYDYPSGHPDTVALFNSTGHQSVIHDIEAVWLSPSRDGLLMGLAGVSDLMESGASARIVDPANNDLAIGVPTIELPDGRRLLPTKSGMRVAGQGYAPPGSGTAHILPPQPCAGPHGPGSSGSSGVDHMCSTRVTAWVADSFGDVWMIISTPANVVGLAKAQSL